MEEMKERLVQILDPKTREVKYESDSFIVILSEPGERKTRMYTHMELVGGAEQLISLADVMLNQLEEVMQQMTLRAPDIRLKIAAMSIEVAHNLLTKFMEERGMVARVCVDGDRGADKMEELGNKATLQLDEQLQEFLNSLKE